MMLDEIQWAWGKRKKRNPAHLFPAHAFDCGWTDGQMGTLSKCGYAFSYDAGLYEPEKNAARCSYCERLSKGI